MPKKGVGCIENYIFPKMLRQFYFIYGRISLIIFLCFIICMFVFGIRQASSDLTGEVIAALFCVLFIYYAAVWVCNYNLIKATYSIDLQTACNILENGTRITILLQDAMHSEFTHKFHFAKGSMEEKYIIYSYEEIGNLSGVNIYKVIRKIWRSNAVIIPRGQGTVLLSPDSQSE